MTILIFFCFYCFLTLPHLTISSKTDFFSWHSCFTARLAMLVKHLLVVYVWCGYQLEQQAACRDWFWFLLGVMVGWQVRSKNVDHLDESLNHLTINLPPPLPKIIPRMCHLFQNTHSIKSDTMYEIRESSRLSKSSSLNEFREPKGWKCNCSDSTRYLNWY